MITLLILLALAQPTTGVRVVEVPRAPQSIQIEGVDAAESSPNAVHQRIPPLLLRLPTNARGDLIRPQSARQMATIVHKALPEGYIRSLMWTFGYVRESNGCCTQQQDLVDLRLRDIYVYLDQVWSLHNRSHRLGREISCLDLGEGSLLPVIALVVQLERMDYSYIRRIDMPRDVQIGGVIAVSQRLLFLCETGR